jgi:transposase
MDQVCRVEMAQDAPMVRAALGAWDRKTLRQLMWGMRRNPSGWSRHQLSAMHWLQRSAL